MRWIETIQFQTSIAVGSSSMWKVNEIRNKQKQNISSVCIVYLFIIDWRVQLISKLWPCTKQRKIKRGAFPSVVFPNVINDTAIGNSDKTRRHKSYELWNLMILTSSLLFVFH